MLRGGLRLLLYSGSEAFDVLLVIEKRYECCMCFEHAYENNNVSTFRVLTNENIVPQSPYTTQYVEHTTNAVNIVRCLMRVMFWIC